MNNIEHEALYDFIVTVLKVQMNWSTEKAHDWMLDENPFFGNSAPADIIFCGRSHKVMKFIQSALEEYRT